MVNHSLAKTIKRKHTEDQVMAIYAEVRTGVRIATPTVREVGKLVGVTHTGVRKICLRLCDLGYMCQDDTGKFGITSEGMERLSRNGRME